MKIKLPLTEDEIQDLADNQRAIIFNPPELPNVTIEVTTMTDQCVICEKEYAGYGHNPQPLAEIGRACDSCNALVISARIAQITKKG